jgi:sulfhydrogenase subunit beta (sulfur reductase)
MILERFYISREHWLTALSDWTRKHRVYAPFREGGRVLFGPLGRERMPVPVFDGARTDQSMKPFLFPAVEPLFPEPKNDGLPTLLLGVRACDLAAIQVLDRALAGEGPHSSYVKRRSLVLVIGADCTQPHKTCFCTEVGGSPFPIDGFDLNMSKIWDGYVIEVGSDAGRSLLEGFDRSVKPLVREEEETQQRMRAETERKVRKLNEAFGILDPSSATLRNEAVWAAHASACLSCGACNWSCPTCHSFDVRVESSGPARLRRVWDACLLPGFDRMADGRTSRPFRIDRLRHRISCKFQYQSAGPGRTGCTGCGRCVSACPAGIDMRQALFAGMETGRMARKDAEE